MTKSNIYYVEGPYCDPYMVEAENEQDALDKCYDYEFNVYDVWASNGFDDEGIWHEDYFPMENDFKIISFDEFNKSPFYKDLVHCDFKFKYDISDLCELKDNPYYEN